MNSAISEKGLRMDELTEQDYIRNHLQGDRI